MTAGRDRLPGIGPERSFTLPQAETRVLRGGVRLWTVEHQDVPVLAITWLVPAGSAADPPERPGLAALVADLLDEGSVCARNSITIRIQRKAHYERAHMQPAPELP